MASTVDASLKEESTKPPARYNEATLLSAMEGAGKFVGDEELAEAMKERGLGTPATRADIIDGLINQKYVERMQRDLIPTPKAEQLLEFLAAVSAVQLTSPAMTGEWEYKLRQIEQGKFSREQFMAEIVEVTKGIVDRTRNFEEDESTARRTDIPSPTDGLPMLQTLRGYKSQDGRLTIYKVMSGRKIEESEVRQLAAARELGPLDGFVSARTGNRFPAKLRIVPGAEEGQLKVELDFGNKVELSELVPFWTDPKTGAELCEAPTNYVLRQREGDEWKSVFQVGRLMCQKAITREHVMQLVTDGKTELIKGFISKRGRPFDAFLLRNGARINWEFPPREAKAGGAARTRKAKEMPDWTKATPLGESRVHGGELFQTDDSFVVRKLGANDEPRVVFTLKRTLCEKEITSEIVRQLLSDGRTELIDGFKSKRGSTFGAYLVLSKNKTKADFEFPPR